MPIRPDLKPLYPDTWEEIRTKILTRAGNRCERCYLNNGAFGLRDKKGAFHHSWEWDHKAFDDDDYFDGAKPFTVVLTIAHLDHDVTNNDGMENGGPALPVDDANLLALCCQCHNRHDGSHRQINRGLTLDTKRGQGRLFE